jgi:hypothetical protein
MGDLLEARARLALRELVHIILGEEEGRLRTWSRLQAQQHRRCRADLEFNVRVRVAPDLARHA